MRRDTNTYSHCMRPQQRPRRSSCGPTCLSPAVLNTQRLNSSLSPTQLLVGARGVLTRKSSSEIARTFADHFQPLPPQHAPPSCPVTRERRRELPSSRAAWGRRGPSAFSISEEAGRIPPSPATLPRQPPRASFDPSCDSTTTFALLLVGPPPFSMKRLPKHSSVDGRALLPRPPTTLP